MARASNSGGMSPLARLLRRRQDDGLTFGEMARIATRKGLDLSDSRISQIANDQSAGRLPPDTIKALAVVLDEDPAYLADLDDQRFGLGRKHVALDQPHDRDIATFPTEVVLAEAAKRLGEQNPERRK